MNKQTKILLGVGAVGVVGYLIWKQNQDKKTFTPPDNTYVRKNVNMNKIRAIRQQAMDDWNKFGLWRSGYGDYYSPHGVLPPGLR